ncbi:MAG: hypothetical protein IID16_06010 [Candidatus Marinimicrobia bacterium]|nr:hypothetical protein [Candidatus Neomarinimicrobiota bacterium]
MKISAKIVVGIISVVILLFLQEMVIFNKLSVTGDPISRVPVSKWANEYVDINGNIPQWFPHLFAGMPSYGGYVYTPADPVINLLRPIFFNQGIRYYFYFLLGGIGMFLFLRRRKFQQISSLLGSLIFALSPYLFGLINAGHPAKLYAIGYIPFVFLAFDYLTKQQTIRGVLYLGILTALQLWTKHVQIVYYTWMLVTFLFLWNQISALTKKKWTVRREGKQIGILLAGLFVALLLVSDPYASIFQFQKHSTRGAASVLDKTEETGSGTRWDYATRWSFHPKETISFIYPYFYGLQNYPTRDLKSMAYWGYMPFTQSTHYLGLLAVLIAIIGLIIKKPDHTTLPFIVGTGLILLVGFGNHFPILFWPLFKFAPFFSKFRVPSMIYALLPFTVGYLASIGLDNIMKLLNKGDIKEFQKLKKWGIGLFGVVVGFSLLFLIIGDGLSNMFGFFSHPADMSKIRPELLTQLKEVRVEVFQKGMLLSLMVSLLGLSAIWLGVKKHIKSTAFGVIILLVFVVDLWIVDHEFLALEPSKNLQRNFRKNPVVNFLKQDKDLFRIFPVDDFSSNWYGYFGLSSVGGYRAVKLRTYQDLMDVGGMNNPSVLNMLNVKYLITKRNIKIPDFEKVFSEGQNIYQNLSVLPKAWIVPKIIAVETQKESLSKTMVSEFNPAVEAVVLDYDGPELEKNSIGTVIVKKYSENEIVLQSNSETGGLLVLSENYYGPGWKATVDNHSSKIFQTNHVLRSIYVFSGVHTIIFRYDDSLYKISRLISRISLGLVLLGIVYFHRKSMMLMLNKIGLK